MPHKQPENSRPEDPNRQEAAPAADSPAAGAPPPGEPSAVPTEHEQALAELNDRYLRLMAEYDNYRKRTAREREGLYKEARANTLEAFLPVADDFARALAAPSGDADFRKGMELIHAAFWQALTRFGVERFGEPGEVFDPELHAAVAHVESDELEAGRIAQVYSPGYRMDGKMLRPATVVVAN